MSVSSLDKNRIAQAVQAALAQCLGLRPLTLEDARRMALLAEDMAVRMQVPVVCAVVDAQGGLLLMHRMDGSLPASLDLAVNKAYTAAAFRMPTHALGKMAQPGQALYGVEATNQGRVVIFGGGYPCRRDEAVVGAIGISGGTVEEDMQIATHALQSFLEETELCSGGEKRYE
jgi:uncharacterized protein GlcG (DUF336 family)